MLCIMLNVFYTFYLFVILLDKYFFFSTDIMYSFYYYVMNDQ